jgi:hypothetical protein
LFGEEDNRKADGDKGDNDGGGNHESLPSLVALDLSVLPDDVGRLASASEGQFLRAENRLVRLSEPAEIVARDFVVETPVHTVFLLEGDKAANGLRNCVVLFVLQLADLLFHFAHFVEALVDYVLASFTEQSDQLGVVVSERDVHDFNLNAGLFGLLSHDRSVGPGALVVPS